MAVATVWYAFAVAAGAFRSTAVEYRKSRAQHTAIWLMASELPVFADMAVPGSMGAKVITLPGYFTAAAAGEGEGAFEVAKVECAEMLQGKGDVLESLFHSHMYAGDEEEDGDVSDDAAERSGSGGGVASLGCLEGGGVEVRF